jgi:hypothetical protein
MRRGDFTVFVWASDVALAVGGWRHHAGMLLVAAAVIGLLLLGRTARRRPNISYLLLANQR